MNDSTPHAAAPETGATPTDTTNTAADTPAAAAPVEAAEQEAAPTAPPRARRPRAPRASKAAARPEAEPPAEAVAAPGTDAPEGDEPLAASAESVAAEGGDAPEPRPADDDRHPHRPEEALLTPAGAELAAAEPDLLDAPALTPEPVEPPRATFEDLGLSEPILKAVSESGYVHPTPIQEQAIPIVLMGRDVLGCAQTGTGKTASFTLPMMDILSGSRAKARMPRSLILEPTRELALQVAEQFVKYGKYLNLTHALLIGGESMDEQKAVLEKGVDVLIATPGRLLDLFDRGRILMADCKLLVIDEADRMLDMGFIPDVERIVSIIPRMRQTLFFSATMAPEIRRLADAFLQNPKEITVSRPATVATTITTGLVYVQPMDKREALRRLIRREQVQNALIFCNRKVDVDILYKSLKKHGFSVGALHGDMDQSSRFATLNAFKANQIRLLVCSDVAARGLDIGGLSHVFNFDVPFHSEDYVHRIGRTGRAGKEGVAYTIATADDGKLVTAIEKLTGKPIPRLEVEGLDPVTDEEIAEAATRKRGRGGMMRPEARSGRGGDRRRSGGGGEERGPREPRGRDEERRPRERDRDREERAPRPVEAAAEDRRPRPDRDDRRRGEDRPRRDEGPRGASPDRGEASPRRRDPREDAPRRDPRRDDLGPSVRGFGDSVPAFMLIPIPRPKRERNPTPTASEAAPPAETDEAA